MLLLLQQAFNQLAAEVLQSGYEILLEADAVGWLFHLMVTKLEVNPHHVHLDTRVCDAEGKFDLAIGPVYYEDGGRPCVRPQAVAEVKVFPRIGFTDQQHRVHYQAVLNDDLRKLGTLASAVEVCAAKMVDGRGYLDGTYQGRNRKQYVIGMRNAVAPGAHVFVVQLVRERWMVEHDAPTLVSKPDRQAQAGSVSDG